MSPNYVYNCIKQIYLSLGYDTVTYGMSATSHIPRRDVWTAEWGVGEMDNYIIGLGLSHGKYFVISKIDRS